MPQQITIPRLGWSMEEGIFGEWLRTSGEFIRAGEMLFVLEGEKAAQDIEALESGYLHIPAQTPHGGDTVKVGQVIGFLLAEGESPPAPTVNPPTANSPSVHAPIRTELPRVAGPAARRLARQLGINLRTVATPDPTGRVLCEDIERAAAWQRHAAPAARATPIATPRARRRARELGVDWTRLAGTGRDGRIRERDVLFDPRRSAPAVHSSWSEIAPVTPGQHMPATKLRKSLAQRMQAGVTEAAPVTLTTKVDAAALVALRTKLKSQSQDAQPSPTYNDILIGLTARTLKKVPELNACWHHDGIHVYDAIHIATAIDTPAGLLAPVIRDADRLSVPQIAAQTRQLIEQARVGRLSQTQLTGGTFTVSNLGMFGIDSFTPILNLPQAGILGVGRIVEEPVVRAGHVEVGQTISLSLTFDHRVIDGAPAARWLQQLCQAMVTLE